MMVTVNVECTPEEARRTMGLPDLTPIHDLYIDRMKQTISEGVSPEMIERMMRSWAPMGEAGMNMWRQLIDQMTGTGRK